MKKTAEFRRVGGTELRYVVCYGIISAFKKPKGVEKRNGTW
jgi:hypothetical protein